MLFVIKGLLQHQFSRRGQRGERSRPFPVSDATNNSGAIHRDTHEG
jgi:hypothetical protein